MTSIHDLSLDLVEEILSRVPMTSLGATRSTCKLWNTLSKDPTFKYRGREAKENMVVMMHDFEACLMSVNTHNHRDLVDPFIRQIGKLKQVKIREVFHCNGLLLCITYEHNTSRLVVWNPYSGQTRWIQPRNDYCTSGPDIYAMGYDSNNNHKILRVSVWLNQYSYEVYDLKSSSWRTPDVSIDWYIHRHGVSLKGNSYFITEYKNGVVGEEEEEAVENRLLCFDFTRETFWDLPLPFPLSCDGEDSDSVVVSVVREEKLAVLSKRYGALEIWITNKIEPNAVSWSYFLKADKIPSNRFLYLFGSFFVDDKKKVAVICDADWRVRSNYKACMVGEGGHYREMDLRESKCQVLMSSPYVPSWVQIQ